MRNIKGYALHCILSMLSLSSFLHSVNLGREEGSSSVKDK